jgi:hypothetical protein
MSRAETKCSERIASNGCDCFRSDREVQQLHRYPAKPDSPSKVFQMLFVRTQIGKAGAEFSEPYDGTLLTPKMAGFEDSQAFANDARRGPAEFADEQG